MGSCILSDFCRDQVDHRFEPVSSAAGHEVTVSAQRKLDARVSGLMGIRDHLRRFPETDKIVK